MIYEFLSKSVGELYSYQRRLLTSGDNMIAHYEPRRLLNEHATITLGFHRQAGHSSALRQFLTPVPELAAIIPSSFSSLFQDPLIITYTVEAQRYYPGHRTLSREQARKRPQDGRPINLVAVDGTYCWPVKQREQALAWIADVAYEHLFVKHPFVLILLQ